MALSYEPDGTPLCDTHTVLNRIPLNELSELVNEPVSDFVG